MNTIFSREHSSIPFGLYRINKDYLNFLKKQEPNVHNPNENLYCGPVVTIFDHDSKTQHEFFVPIIETPDNPDNYNFEGPAEMFINHVYGELDFRLMVPASEQVLTADTENTEKLEDFTDDRDVIEKMARTAYIEITNKTN